MQEETFHEAIIIHENRIFTKYDTERKKMAISYTRKEGMNDKGCDVTASHWGRVVVI